MTHFKISLGTNQDNFNSEENSDEEELPESYDGPYKMVFVVNMELGMGVGKISAQVHIHS